MFFLHSFFGGFTLSQLGRGVYRVNGILYFVSIILVNIYCDCVGSFDKSDVLAKTAKIIWDYEVFFFFTENGDVGTRESFAGQSDASFGSD